MTQIRWGGKWVHLTYSWIVSHLSAKNYQNRWKFDEVLTKTNLLSFFWDTVYILLIFINVQWVAPLCCISSIRTISNTEAPPGESQWKQVTACCSAWQRYALYRLPCTFYPNVTTLGSGLCYRKSVCHLFVCLSVTSVHPTQGVERWTFWQYFFTALTSVQNFTKIVPGEPLHRRR